MANPVIINPTLTLAGQAAAFNASNDGLDLKLTHVSFGTAHYDPTGDEVALKSPVGSKVPLAGGSRPTPYQLRMVSSWREDVGEVAIAEIAFWADDVLAFVWSKADGTIASYKTDGVSYVLFNDLAFAQVPAGSIGFVVDPNESVALAALVAHEGAPNAHPQYLLRSDVAKDSGALAWLGLAAGTANALDLTLVAVEAVLPSYAPGQRFQFRAQSTNTGPVTAKISGLGVKSVKKAGDAGLIDVEPGDIKIGALYDLNYDGTYFQLGGGVGSGKAFVRFAFTATLAQTIFPADHTVGATIVLRNGREVTDYLSDGAKITMKAPCGLDDSVEILAFKSFKVADTYTKAELNALLAAAQGIPVGAMLPFPGPNVPPGFFEVDGSVRSAAAYPELNAFLGGRFNRGDEGSGNFRLPDSRAEFLRGWDHGRGIDPDREIGSFQKGSLQTFDPSTAQAAATGLWHDNGDDTNAATIHGLDKVDLASYQVSYAQGVISTVQNMQGRGLGVSRPRNLAVMWCIKAWGGAINQGNIDIAALAAQVASFDANAGATVGVCRNARVTVSAASALATFKADEVVVGVPGTGKTYKINNFTKQVNLGAVGIGGMDALTAPKSGYVALYAAYNPTTKEVGIFCANATATAAPDMYVGLNLPIGYAATALVSVWATTADGLFRPGVQVGRTVSIPVTNVMNATQVGVGTIPLSAAVPLNAVGVRGSCGASSNAGAINIQVSSDAQGNGAKQVTGSSLTNLTGGYCLRIVEPQKAYYNFSATGTSAGMSVFVSEYEF